MPLTCVRQGFESASYCYPVSSATKSGQVHEVVVTREGGMWLADVPGLDGARTFARSLPSLDQAVREVVVLAADLPDGAMPGLVLDYRCETGGPELDAKALAVRRLRRQADELAAEVAARTRAGGGRDGRPGSVGS